MARKKKRDFWDDVGEDVVVQEKPQNQTKDPENQSEYTEYDIEDEGFKLTKCMPVKIAARIILCIAAVVIGLSGYICYKYVEDRYIDGAYSTSYFDSNGFSREYNECVNHLIKALKAIEDEGDVTPERAAELAAAIMGDTGNFSYFVLDENQERVVVSGDDAKERIESSNHYVEINTLDNQLDVIPGVPTKELNKAGWKSALEELNNAYDIYTAVDNNLTQEDNFYNSYLEYQKLTDYFAKAKIFGIAAIVVFIVMLIYCIMATGMEKGNSGVRLGWFDRFYTEPSAILIVAVIGALAYGMFYLMGHDVKFGGYLKIADAFLIYVFLIRGYFSLVRRIKGGTFITNSLIYKVCHVINKGLDKLPRPLKVIIIVLILVAINGGLVYALLYQREITVGNIPLIFIVAPVVFIIELIAFIGCIFGIGDTEYEQAYEDEGDDQDTTLANSSSGDDMPPVRDTLSDAESWDEMDFSKAIDAVSDGSFEDHSGVSKGATQVNLHTTTSDKTMVLSNEERNQVLDALGMGASQETQMLNTEEIKRAASKVQTKSNASAGAETVPLTQITQEVQKAVVKGPEPVKVEKIERVSAAEKNKDVSVLPEMKKEDPGKAVSGEAQTADLIEDYGLVDFIQLNKDVRKLFRAKLKARSIGVTLRAPEKPILLDIDKSNAVKVLSILFDNVEKYAAEGSRVYIEMYAQNGKMIYLMKNTIREDLLEQTTNAMGRGLMEVRRIIQSEKGKLINSVEGDIYKVGILLDVADPKKL